jgi:hypothetical protein
LRIFTSFCSQNIALNFGLASVQKQPLCQQQYQQLPSNEQQHTDLQQVLFLQGLAMQIRKPIICSFIAEMFFFLFETAILCMVGIITAGNCDSEDEGICPAAINIFRAVYASASTAEQCHQPFLRDNEDIHWRRSCHFFHDIHVVFTLFLSLSLSLSLSAGNASFAGC